MSKLDKARKGAVESFVDDVLLEEFKRKDGRPAYPEMPQVHVTFIFFLFFYFFFIFYFFLYLPFFYTLLYLTLLLLLLLLLFLCANKVLISVTGGARNFEMPSEKLQQVIAFSEKVLAQLSF